MTFDYSLYRACLETRILGQSFQHFKSVDSTNAYAKRMARQTPDPSESLVIVADTQTGGYGQHGRTWASTEGQGLYFTALMPAQSTPLVTLAVGVAVIEALRALTGSEEPGLKWVNDLVLRGQKLGGILVEACHQRWMAIGIGLNLQAVPEHQGIGLDRLPSFDEGRPWRREQVLAEVLNHLEPWIERLLAGDADAIRQHWEAYSVTLGQDVRVESGSRELVGRAVGIDPSGALKVRTGDGRIEVVTTGTVRRADGAYC
jgi:BirA family biotin operon repressor/biotin-[acetyl-CoA-carboxylase] ligase